uniref:prepilin peptidase n=1 Tax=Agathobacter sp. TaxID=2021311 RepID=UPI0040564E17
MWIVYMLTLAAAGMDIKQNRISNRLIVIGLGIAFVRRIILKGTVGIVEVLLLSSFPVIVLYLLFLSGILGAGDIKLFSLIGGFLNFRQLVSCMVYAFFAAAVFSLGKMLVNGRLKTGLLQGCNYMRGLLEGDRKAYEPQNREKHVICFSVPILIGLAVSEWFPL